ncbi:MAG TPA: DUF4265 domain-containing protein [Thermoanaerobaculia bacterium]|nr:DUF4265 domain-containing protein [Thermoanaerobaculia bacterium]
MDKQDVKVHVTFENGSGECLWARQTDGDLYAIQNVPFRAFGLNHGDIVRATTDGAELEVERVVQPSGHMTMRLIFSEHIRGDAQQPYLDAIKKHGGQLERADGSLVAVDVPDVSLWNAIVALLESFEAANVLHFETCQERQPGRFDAGDAPAVAM